MTRLIFLGTPEAALPTAKALGQRLGLVITRPDRPRGRSGKPQPPPVGEWASSAGIPVSQPSNRMELIDAIRARGPFDLGIVVAYGRILPLEALELPTHGMLNVHFSLLPRWRGAAPVARALLAGDTMTGVTIIRLDEGLDTGPVLNAQAVDVKRGETTGELTGRLAGLGAHLLEKVVEPYLAGELTPVPQTEEGATYADKIVAEDRPLHPESSPDLFLNRVRALSPTPGATLAIDGEVFKILDAERSAENPPREGSWHASAEGQPLVRVGDAAILLTRLQPPGRNEMSGADWLRGVHRPGGGVG